MNRDTNEGQTKETTNNPVTEVISELPTATKQLESQQIPQKDTPPTTDQEKFNDPTAIIDVPKIENAKGGQSSASTQKQPLETLNFTVKKNLDEVREYQTISLATPEESILAKRTTEVPDEEKLNAKEPVIKSHIEEVKESNAPVK